MRIFTSQEQALEAMGHYNQASIPSCNFLVLIDGPEPGTWEIIPLWMAQKLNLKYSIG